LPSLVAVRLTQKAYKRAHQSLLDIAQIGALGANTKVVQHDIALGELVFGRIALDLESLLDGLQVLVRLTLLQLC